MKNLLLFLTLITMSCSAQNSNYDVILKELDKNTQLKLDTGRFMLQTEREYAIKLDSLMSIIYLDLNDAKNIDKANLKKEQNKWDLQNQLKIKNIWKTLKESNSEAGFIANDEKMFAYAERAQLTRERILELISKYNN